MIQTSESPRAPSPMPGTALKLRPLSRALGAAGCRGHWLLLVSASLWLPVPLPAQVQAQAIPVACADDSPLTCTVAAAETLTSSLTLRNAYRDSQITNTADFHVVGTTVAGSGQETLISDYEYAVIGGAFSGIQVVSQGTDGSDNGSQHHRDGGAAMGAMLTTSGSVVLDLAGVTTTQPVIGVAVSSVGGNGFDQPTDHNNGGNGGAAGSTTLFNSSAVTISGGTASGGVVGALVESRGGNGGGQTAAIIDYYGGNGGSTQNIEMDNYAKVAVGTAAAPLQGATRAWGVAAQNVGGDGHGSAKGELPMGDGGDAANVRVLNTGDVAVFLARTADAPDGVVGVLAQSVGGVGGYSNWKFDNAGDGGSAGEVNLVAGDASLATVTTIDVGVDQAVSGTSAGILAQSLGGNGGDQLSNGAKGGQGGQSGAVTVDLNWVQLTTTGDQVGGVVAASRAGNGGSDSEDSYRTDGGDGGQAGTVTVTLTSMGNQTAQQTLVSTQGAQAVGVSAQSVGGFGGDAVKNGGMGQSGATAQITADTNTTILTSGTDAFGLLAQSIGGGGGLGEDFTSGLIGGSGNGGNGGNGAQATLNTSSTVHTTGQYAHGLIAQSVGGSGGAGAVAGSVVALGGNGGAGGAGGAATIQGVARVQTEGEGAIAVIGQSVGGGGGVAGSATGLYAIGGSVSDAQDNSAGAVNVEVGMVQTQGDGAIGILAQSIGGGGGSGGSALGVSAVGGSGSSGGAGGTVTVDPGIRVLTQGRYALGVLAQSIGGGGGNGGQALAIAPGVSSSAIGGQAGTGSAASKVTVQTSGAGQIQTAGDGATAVLAQSIGGGGGHGGSAQLDGVLSPVTVAIGGKAGGGGAGGEVETVLSNFQLVTQGNSAAGVVAQSIGGGGGNGGAAHSFVAGVGFNLGVDVGGSGGLGGAGEQVTVELNNTTISTAGVGTSGSNAAANGASQAYADTYGLVAQSIGGGGGTGGSAAARSIIVAVPDPDASFAIASNVTVGGSGGSGGVAGEVDVRLEQGSAIFTGGQGSHGVVAQSIGGGGGNGGASQAMSTDVSIPTQSVSVNVDVAVGGSGGLGGTGGLVTLDVGAAGRITTFDDLSNGVLAQSIGGGGGNAGVGSSGSGGLAQGKAYNVLVGVGGSAGEGGSGGEIQASLAPTASITTYGSGARGLVLHSVGGGGGAAQGTTVDLGGPVAFGGGSSEAVSGGAAQDDPAPGKTTLTAAVSVSVGATGGSGGDGGAVTLTSQGAIQTSGDDADGVLIQSIGGGGGLGGNAGADASAGPSSYQLPEEPSNDPPSSDPPGTTPPDNGAPGDNPASPDTDLGSYSLAVAVGGSGGTSGAGGHVEVDHSGAITTAGALADAMVVQSIGAGGGVGGASTAKGALGSSQFNVSVGGSGGAGGAGGDIVLNLTANADNTPASFTTSGDASYGLLAQSIGGGGGQGAVASNIITKSTLEHPSLLLGWAGEGGNRGNGGQVTLNAANSAVAVRTAGAEAHGIVLQSIGGGGGTASVSGASLGGTAHDPELTVQLGGGGGAGSSHGGDITVNTWLQALTQGEHAFGVVAQSIGGGGGIASAGPGAGIQSVTVQPAAAGLPMVAGDLDITFGANSATGTASSITTAGRGAHGLVLQSIVGGGGIGGDTAVGPLTLGWAGLASTAGFGTSGNIDLTLGGDIHTAGAGAHGVIAQSLGAPGGLGGTSAGSFAGVLPQAGGGSTSGHINLTLDGTVQVTGENAWGVFAQTYDTASTTPAPVTVTVSGQVVGGAPGSASSTGQPSGGAIWVDGRAANTVTIAAGASVDGAQGQAAFQQTGSGTLSVNNQGTVSGDFLTSTASASALVNTGTVSQLRLVQGSLENQGQVTVGAGAGADTLRVSGNLSQGRDGVLNLGADFVAGTSDALVVDGHAALDGTLQLQPSTLAPAQALTVVQAGSLAGAVTVQGASPLFTYGTTQAGAAVSVTAQAAHFDAISRDTGLGSNLHAVGEHLQDIWDRGGSEPLGALYAQLDRSVASGAAAYGSAMTDLSLGASAAPAALATGAVKGFADRMFRCEAGDAVLTAAAGSRCIWGEGGGKTVHLDGHGGTAATRARAQSYQFGMQQRLSGGWVLGASAAYEHNTIRSNDERVRIKGNAGYLGAVLQYETGPWTLGTATFGSYGSYDGTRGVRVANAVASSDFKVWSVGQQVRAAYRQGSEQGYVQPFITLDVIYTRMPSYEERGAGALDLHVRSANRVAAVFTPGVQVGGSMDLPKGYVLRPYASLGVSLSSAQRWNTSASLAGRPAGSTSFDTTLETGRVYGQVSAGVALLNQGGLAVQLQYDGVVSGRARSSGGSLKATWRF